jgi:carbon storage regulator
LDNLQDRLMLVLTRKQLQALCINGNITVTVLKVRGNQVRLGLELPPGLPVRRQPAPERRRLPQP